MIRLIRTDFGIALRSAETVFGLALEFIGGLAGMMIVCYKGLSLPDLIYMYIIAGIFLAFALSLDNGFGTVRSRLIIGFTKLRVIFAKTAAAVLLSVVYMLAGTAPMLVFCRGQMLRFHTPEQLLRGFMIMLCGFFVTAVFAAVISTLIFSRTWALMMTVFIFGGVLLGAGYLGEQFLYQAEYKVVDGGGKMKLAENDRYLKSPVRELADAVIYSVPSSQGELFSGAYTKKTDGWRREREILTQKLANYDPEELSDSFAADTLREDYEKYLRSRIDMYERIESGFGFIPLYSLAMMLAVTLAGALIYRRRNIE